MSEFTKALCVSPLADGRTWVLLEPFAYDVGTLGSGDTIQVPALFLTDFASIPRVLWSVWPQWGRYGNAAVIHDFGYRTQTRPRREVDRILLEGMTVLGVGRITRRLIWLGVRCFGWIAWRKDRHAGPMTADRLPERSTDLPADTQLGVG